jgi:acetyl esterase/lipase
MNRRSPLAGLAVLLLLPALLLAPPARAQQPDAPPPPPALPLWPGGAPLAHGDSAIDRPTITPFLLPAEQRNGTAVVLFPGGGYRNVVMSRAYDVARFLNTLGVQAFVVRYRIGPKYHHPAELMDAQRAIRLVRSRAAEWGIDAGRVGIFGSSAGGHLASTAGTHYDAGKPGAADPIDRVSSRPDFMILEFPVITLKDPYAHEGSRTHLLGENPDPSLVSLLSNETQVTKDTPPTFIVHGTNDRTVPVENSIMFYQALHRAGVPVEMHIFENGPHGFGLGAGNPALSVWPTLLANWLRARGLLATGG